MSRPRTAQRHHGIAFSWALPLALLLLSTIRWRQGQQHHGWAGAAADAVGNSTTTEPVVEELPSRYAHAQSDADMELLYRTCLEPDLQPHAGRGYALRDIAATVKAQRSVRFYKHLSLVTVRDGVVRAATFSPSGTAPSPTPRRVNATIHAVRDASQLGVKLPDCIFVLSTWDEPRCAARQPSRCPAPVLSLVKTWKWDASPDTSPSSSPTSSSSSSATATAGAGASAAVVPGGASDHTDILVPFFNHVYQQVVDYPWELKTPKALMRAAMQNGMPPRNTRLALVALSQTPEGARLLDAGITHNLKETMKIDTVPQVSLPDHAKWRYLISADGYTASCRLGKLLGINSVVVKEATQWVEYYYRALEPGTHFVPFTRADALQVLKRVHALPDEAHRAMARQARQFQQRYLTQHAKVLYLRQALRRYVLLFPGVDMAGFVRGLDEARLHDLKYLVAELERTGGQANLVP